MNRYSLMIRYLLTYTVYKKQHIKLGTKNSTFNYCAQTFAYAVSKPKVSGVNQFHEKPQKCYKYVPTPKTQNPHLTRKFEVTSVCGRKGGFYGVICCKFSGGESREGFSSGSSVECMRRSDRGSSSSHSTTICQVNPKRAQRMAWFSLSEPLNEQKRCAKKDLFFLQLPFLLLLLLFFAFQNFNNGNAYSIVWGCYQGRTFLGETNLPLNCHPFFVRRLCLLLCSLLHLRCQQTPCKKYRCGASFATIHCVSRYSKQVPKRYRISNFHMRSW